MESVNPGTNPGNETRIRLLEQTVREQNQRINTMLAMLKHGQRFSGGGGTTICLASANADFDTADASVSVTIRQSLQGSASGTVTAYNELQTYGTAGVYAWAGAENTQMWIIKSEEKSGLIDQWRILNIVPTDCDCA